MTKRKISDHFSIDFGTANPAWRQMRNSPGVDQYLHHVGEQTVARCNAELRAAEAKRKQPEEDGYDFGVKHGSRSRLTIYPDTPRGMAHEAVHQAILKNITIGTVKGAARGPDHDIPRELARRANEAREHPGRDQHGHEIHDLDRPDR